MLTENEQIKGEHFEPTERIKLYIVEVKNTTKRTKDSCIPYASGACKASV